MDFGYTPAPGESFVLIDNDGADAIVGRFGNVPTSGPFETSEGRFYIDYSGGDGNDLEITRNRRPQNLGVTQNVDEDQMLAGVPGAFDPEGETLTYTLDNPPIYSSAFQFNSDGTFQYQDNLHRSGADSFSYTVSDGDLDDSFTLFIDVQPVADAPNLTVADTSGEEGTPIPLTISTSLVDTDGSESISLVLSGIPAGTILNQGTLDGGSGDWLLTPSDLTGLTIESPDNQTFPITVTSISSEAFGGSQASTVDNDQCHCRQRRPSGDGFQSDRRFTVATQLD